MNINIPRLDTEKIIDHLSSLQDTFHSEHYITLEMKRKFIELIGKQRYSYDGVAGELLERKVLYCREHLELQIAQPLYSFPLGLSTSHHEVRDQFLFGDWILFFHLNELDFHRDATRNANGVLWNRQSASWASRICSYYCPGQDLCCLSSVLRQ